MTTSFLQTPHPDKAAWDAFVTAHPQAHLLQSSRWGELKDRFGWSVERVALSTPSEDLIAGAQILYRHLPYGLGTLAYVPKGPLVDWKNDKLVSELVTTLDKATRSRGALALTLEPNLPDEAKHTNHLSKAGFVPGANEFQPRRTILVDLSPTEVEILATMKSKTRYNIRLSARKGVIVRQGNPGDVKRFNRLMEATGERNRFGVRSPAYHRAAFELFHHAGQAALFLAEYQGEPLAGLMIFALKDTAWYLHGASSSAHRNLMAPYAAHWAAMRWAKSIGCTTYDLWGVPDADEETLEAQFTQRSDGLWGVYRSKRGYGGRLFRTVGAWDRVYRPLRYRLYKLASRWR